MELTELKVLIREALDDCELKLKEEPEIVLSEADFERLVSWSIMNGLGHRDYQMPRPGDFTVHTQVSHYVDNRNCPDARVDILLLTKEGMKDASGNVLKEYKYLQDSFALELKCFHANDSMSKIKTIWSDFCKREYLDSNSWLYVVALIESDNDEDYSKKKAIIDAMNDDMLKQNPDYQRNLYHYVMRKHKVDWSKFKKE
jgi:hypothetical protein